MADTNQLTSRKPLRLWPGLAAAAILCVALVIPVVFPGAVLVGVLGGVVCGLIIAIWWLLFSRAPWLDRLGAFAVATVAVFATYYVVDPSIAGAGQGNLLIVFSIPVLSLAVVAWAAATRGLSAGRRRAWMVAAIALGCGTFALLRTDGITGGGFPQLRWRWTPTAEQRLLARGGDEPVAPPAAAAAAETPRESPAGAAPSIPAATNPPQERPAESEAAPAPSVAVWKTAPEWPGFRGPDRDGVIHGVRIATDWSQSPPVQLWRRPIGPGWSSFAVRGDIFYTQEQRGEDDVVSAYSMKTGEPVWRHKDRARFYESNGGPGPRGTPTLSNGRVYTFGATGILNALDARSGAVLWTRNVSADAKKAVPMWGFTSSPLMIDDLVVVAASGKLAAYDVATGSPRWFGPAHPGSYSSPHRARIDGVDQILLLTAAGATSVAPDGKVLWEHAFPGGTPIVQPTLVADGDVLISTLESTGGLGTRRLGITHGPKGWSATERWTSTGLKPYFNDSVVHKGHAYGFDGSILSCIDLADGARKWKGGRYGNGQLVLLPDQDLLLVVSEEGELALVKASPDQFEEVAHASGIEGKTWNHPVLVRGVLLVRNGEEMAAFRLSLAESLTTAPAPK